MESNHRPTAYETVGIPLPHSAIVVLFRRLYHYRYNLSIYLAVPLGIEPSSILINSQSRTPCSLWHNKFGGPMGDRTPTSAVQAQCAPIITISPNFYLTFTCFNASFLIRNSRLLSNLDTIRYDTPSISLIKLISLHITFSCVNLFSNNTDFIIVLLTIY